MYSFNELGPEDVSLLERCPHFRGWYVQASKKLEPKDVSLLERCPHFIRCCHYNVPTTCCTKQTKCVCLHYTYIYVLPVSFFVVSCEIESRQKATQCCLHDIWVNLGGEHGGKKDVSFSRRGFRTLISRSCCFRTFGTSEWTTLGLGDKGTCPD